MNIKCQAKKISGIYKIINKLNGKYYIGRSDNIIGTTGRWLEHINALNANRHNNDYLQNAWNKYGKDNFEFVIVEEVPIEKLVETEQKYLDLIKPNRRKLCYNLSLSANGGGHLGCKHTEQTKRHLSEKLKGRILSPETRRKISLSQKGRKPGFSNKTHSEEWKRKNSKRMKEYWAKRKVTLP